MQPADGLAATDDREAGTDPDAAAATYWLRNPEAPRHTSAFADLITQWENEPEWIPGAGIHLNDKGIWGAAETGQHSSKRP
jgi:hypothetical protein